MRLMHSALSMKPPTIPTAVLGLSAASRASTAALQLPRVDSMHGTLRHSQTGAHAPMCPTDPSSQRHTRQSSWLALNDEVTIARLLVSRALSPSKIQRNQPGPAVAFCRYPDGQICDKSKLPSLRWQRVVAQFATPYMYMFYTNLALRCSIPSGPLAPADLPPNRRQNLTM
jgi:hypothetical protein